MSFESDLAALVKRAGDKADLVVRKVSLDLFTSLVLKSPVDTGRFRGNWQVGVNSVNLDTSSAEDADGGAATARASAAIQGVSLGGVIYLTNSLPYAKRLENGWSKQAPAGMVQLTVREYTQYLAKAVGSMK